MADKTYVCLGARNYAKTDRHKEDFYATEPNQKREDELL